ncbi:hypothetical protein [Paraburkholderia dipogonis]|uniref:hypothetical protein n=1 Tax=Paraburkholderia dipogonis TaxID=1211383 RepID=UPI0038B6C2BC
MRGFVREHVAAYKCPKFILFSDWLPRTATGNVQRVEVRRTPRARFDTGRSRPSTDSRQFGRSHS